MENDCNFEDECDGDGVLLCQCPCSRCEDHEQDCDGCRACSREADTDPTLPDDTVWVEADEHCMAYRAGFSAYDRWMYCVDDGCAYERPATNWEQCVNSTRGHVFQPGIDPRYEVCCHCTTPRVRKAA